MKFNFQFSNLCGCVYRHGNLAYTSDGNRLLTPVGNRVTVFDLINHTSQTLRFQMHHNIRCIALSPNDKLLVTIDTNGHCLIINFEKGITLATMKFKENKVACVKFSPNGDYLAVAHSNWVSVWKTPSMIVEWKPMILHGKYRGHYNDILCLDWSKDSLFFVTGSKDMSCRIHCVHKQRPFQSQSLTGHSHYVMGVYFGSDYKLYSLTRDGFIYKWIPGATPEMHAKYGKDSENIDFDIKIMDNNNKNSNKKNKNKNKKNKNKKDKKNKNDNTKNSKKHKKKSKKGSKKLPLLMYAKYAPFGKHRLHIKGKENEAINCASFHRFRIELHNKNSNNSNSNGNENELSVAKPGFAGVFGNDLLVIGLSNGKFSLYQMPEFELIHSLSISNQAISTCVINPTGDWLGLASSKLGQLFVWEWRSETYIMKQQSHFYNINCIAFSGDGQLIASGGMDGKLKIWNAHNGFCFITFFDHSGPITKVQFAKNNVLVITASLDGTVRVYDLIRYINFRTLKPPSKDEYNRYIREQINKSKRENNGEMTKDASEHNDGIPMMNARFISLAIDDSAEIICAGSEDPFNIYVWSMRTGKCLDVLYGHDGPISSLAISSNNQLASGSWDGTLRLWDIYNPNTATEVVDINSEVLDVCYRADGEELALCTLNGQINRINCEEGSVISTYSIKRDVLGGRNRSDKYNLSKSQNKSLKNHYTCLTYSADGRCILAGGNSKYIGLYYINPASHGLQGTTSSLLLLSRFVTCINKDYDGILENLNHSNYVPKLGIYLDNRGKFGSNPSEVKTGTNAMITGDTTDDLLLDSREKNLRKDIIKMKRLNLPGVNMTDYSTRNELSMILTKDVSFSPTNIMFAAATTDGLLLYSQESFMNILNYKLARFNPIDLDIYITPENINKELKKCVSNWYNKNSDDDNEIAIVSNKNGNNDRESSFGRTLVMALKFNDIDLIGKVIEYIPLECIDLCVDGLPMRYIENILIIFAENIVQTQFLQFYLIWIKKLFIKHGNYISQNFNTLLPALRLLHKNINSVYKELSPIVENNCFQLQFLASFHHKNKFMGKGKLKIDNGDEYSVVGRKKIDLETVEKESIALIDPKGEFKPVPFKKYADDPFALVK